MVESVFAAHASKSYPYRWSGEMVVSRIAGGTPSDPRKAEGWIRSKFETTDDIVRQMVGEVMTSREGVTNDEALKEVVDLSRLNGFKRDEQGLYIEARQLAACLKEASNVRWGKARKWGTTGKMTRSWWPEHVFVDDNRLYLGVQEPSRIEQRFVHTFRGSGIQYEEVVDDAKISFSLETDYDFKASEWGDLWTTAERLGIGATRSQGYGRFNVVAWHRND